MQVVVTVLAEGVKTNWNRICLEEFKEGLGMVSGTVDVGLGMLEQAGDAGGGGGGQHGDV